MMDIDFVLPYVNGADPVWKAEMQRYEGVSATRISDAGEHRFRDWGTHKYLLRSLEKYAPWMHKLFFIVSGKEQIPEWLDTSNPLLEVVFHKDFIPGEYLPTFSSHCIELNLHRIPGLAEHFVYFNDDVFLLNPVKPSFFFKRGLPCDTAILRAWPYIVIEPGKKPFVTAIFSVSAINRNFSKSASMRRYFYKWFDPRMGIRIISTLWLLPARQFTGFTCLHLMNPFLRSTFEEVWEHERELLEQTCTHKFREQDDVNQYIFQYWQFASGRFIPRSHEVGRSRTIRRENIDEIKRVMSKRRYKAIALNDADMPYDEFEVVRDEIEKIFSGRLPQKSSFEK